MISRYIYAIQSKSSTYSIALIDHLVEVGEQAESLVEVKVAGAHGD